MLQMEWRHSENGEATKPDEIQFDYRCGTVYVRKNFVKHEAEEKENYTRPEHWSYSEIKIPLEDWEYWKQLTTHSEEISEAQDAAVELAATTSDNTSMIEELQAAIAELGTLSVE